MTWPEKIELDIWYVENWSFWLDLKILFKTLFKVIRAKDIDNAGTPDSISQMRREA